MTRHSDRFRACLKETLRWEGGWSDHPFDPGGKTMKGITIGRYAGHVGALGTALSIDSYGRVTIIDQWVYEQLVEQLRTISDAELAEIYHRYYWQPIHGDELPVVIDMAVFDFAVNSGPVQAIKILQRALRLNQVDGHMGPVTLAAARNVVPAQVLPHFLDRRRQFLRALKTFPHFGNGWLRRVDGLEHRVMADVSALGARRPGPPPIPGWETVVAANPTISAPAVSTARMRSGHPEGPLSDPDAQSATQGRAVATEADSMTKSTTGRAAEAAGGLSGMQLGVEVSGAAARARGSDGAFDLLSFALTLAQSPTFWLAAGAIAAAAYVWLERRRKLILG